MRDHIQVSTPLAVPANALHRQLNRVQAKSSPERLRRLVAETPFICNDQEIALTISLGLLLARHHDLRWAWPLRKRGQGRIESAPT